MEYLVHEPLERLSCVLASKWHPYEIKESKWRNGVVTAVLGTSGGVRGALQSGGRHERDPA